MGQAIRAGADALSSGTLWEIRRPRHAGLTTGVCLTAAACLLATSAAFGVAEFVSHAPTQAVHGEAVDVTMREPDTPREGETVAVWTQIGYSFYWTDAAIYYTTDGSTPAGSYGVATNGTAVPLTFVRNESSPSGQIDWVTANLPSQLYGTTMKYIIGAWHDSGGIEVFANNTGCSDGTCDDPANTPTVFNYTVKLPWPGRGHGNANPNEGFPNIHFWKEEAVVGNNCTNIMIDQNGTVYDMYFPSAGCVWGVGTKNEGYVDGDDTFPPGLPLGYRGQMHLNQAQAGLRVDGVTYWLSNEAGAYSGHAQSYIADNNVVHTTSRLTAGGNSILVDQYDFSPKGVTFPDDNGGQDVREIYVKRYLLTNDGGTGKTIDFYYNADFALNGGDSYDGIFADAARGAMVGYDNTGRNTSTSGEYNPLSYGDYPKNVSVYLGAAMKVCSSVGSSGGTPATDTWRDSSPDNDAAWIGTRITLAAGETKEIDIAMIGGFDNFAGASGTYDYQIAPALDWFLATSMAGIQTGTETYWTDWLASGVELDTPDDEYDTMFKRALLATALHVDAAGGGVIAGMHNGAYPFVWPRDALYAAITLDRTGHTAEAGEIYRFLRDVAYRDNDTWGKGFWYQKYTTDGYVVWNSPQVDETANVPWGGYYHYLCTGDMSFLNNYYTMFYEAGRAMSEDSTIDSRLYFDDTYNLMYSNNVWEDSWDTFIYSNASVERGLRDAASMATAVGNAGDASLFTSRADTIHAGVNARLDWNGENTDISQLGIVYPYETHHAEDPRAALVIDRINGVAGDAWGNIKPLVNYGGEWQDLVNRYWDDTYWWNTSNPNQHGSPWFLTTMWYGQYYAVRQDSNPGKADIDNFKYRIDRTRAFLGPAGLGAEQIAPDVTAQYPDFYLQTAWPNAWESMSTLADCLMMFLGYRPDAPNERVYLAPKLPTGWSTLTYNNVRVLPGRNIDVTCNELPAIWSQTFTNRDGGTVNYDTYIRIPSGTPIAAVKQNGVPVAYTFDAGGSRVHVTGSIDTAAYGTTTVAVITQVPGDFDTDGHVDADDMDSFMACATGPALGPVSAPCMSVDFDNDGDVDSTDFGTFQKCISIGAASADPGCAD